MNSSFLGAQLSDLAVERGIEIMPSLKLQLVELMRAERPTLFRAIAGLLAAGAPPREVLARIEAGGASPFLVNWCGVVINHLAETIAEI